MRFSPRPSPRSSPICTAHRFVTPLALLLCLAASAASFGQESGFSRNAPGVLGLSTQTALGLPGVAYDGPSYSGQYARSGWYARHHQYYAGRYVPYAYRAARPYYYGFDGVCWAPWYAIPQTVKTKVHYPAVYSTPKLGLQYTYPDENDIGLNLPPDPDEPLVPNLSEVVFVDPLISDALALIKRGRYATAGRLLSAELDHPQVSLDVLVLVTEVLFASGKYTAAAKVFRHALVEADSLDPLNGVDISAHFPTPEAFRAMRAAFEEEYPMALRTDDLELLHAGVRLLSGDSAAMETLEELQTGTGGETSRAAKRLYLHFLAVLFDGEPAAEAAAPAEDAAPAETEDAPAEEDPKE